MFGAKYPIILAPMGGVGTPQLAAAVCNAGGLGSLAGAYLTPAQLSAQIQQLRELAAAPFAVNLFIHQPEPLHSDPAPVLSLLARYHQELGIDPPAIPPSPAESYEEQVAVVLAAKVAVFSFTFGIPNRDILDAFRAVGTKLVGTATTVQEGKLLTDAGVDAVVAQGRRQAHTAALLSAGPRTP